MREIGILFTVAAVTIAGACDQGGTSTNDVKEAAIARTREKLELPADAALKATVWVGEQFQDQPTVCGTVSGVGTQQIPPQRFIASTDPLRWQQFEDAHNPIVSSEPDIFPNWTEICGARAQEIASVPSAAPDLPTNSQDLGCGSRLDGNQDGMVQEAEYLSFGFAFDDWDVDGDFRVTPAEFQRCWIRLAPGRFGAAFRRFDEDGSGYLNQEEFFSKDQFKRWDLDGDESIPTAEFP